MTYLRRFLYFSDFSDFLNIYEESINFVLYVIGIFVTFYFVHRLIQKYNKVELQREEVPVSENESEFFFNIRQATLLKEQVCEYLSENQSIFHVDKFDPFSSLSLSLFCKESTQSLQSIRHDNKRCIILNFRQAFNEGETLSNALEIALLKSTFKQKFNFTFKVEQVSNYSEAKAFLNKDVKNKFECLVLFLLTNGNMTESFCINELLEYFNYNEGRKSKIIFLLGSKIEHIKSSPETPCIKTKSYADFLLFYGEHVSSTIQSLCTILQENVSNEYDLVTMLKMVFHDLATKSNQDDLPFIISALTKLIFIESFRHIAPQARKWGKLCVDYMTVYPEPKYRISNGLCLIFNFKKMHQENDMDVDALKVTFNELHFDISENRNLSKNEMLDKLNEVFNFANYDCFVICVLGSGFIGGCRSGVEINIEDLVKVLADNESLNPKPKLLFIQAQASQNKETEKYDQPILFKICSDVFIFYGIFQDVHQHEHIKNWSNWFIELLCDELRIGGPIDLETKAKEVADALEVCYTDNKDKIRMKFQIPYYYSTLIGPLFFEPNEEKLNQMPERGRCVILNFTEKRQFDTTALTASFVDLNFYCKTHYKPDYDETIGILEKESQKTAANCKCLVLCIYSKCYGKVFQCGDRDVKFKEVLSHFRKTPTNIPIYIFINSTKNISLEDGFIQNDYYFEQVGNVFLSYNSHPVNQLAKAILQTSWPKEKTISEMLTEMTDTGAVSNDNNDDHADQKDSSLWKKLQLVCLTNTNELLPQVLVNTDSPIDLDFNEMTFHQDEHKRNRCLVLWFNAETNSEPSIVKKVEKIFQNLPQFDTKVESMQNKSEISSALVRENDSLECYNSLMVFIFADLTQNEIHEINIKNIFVQKSTEEQTIPKIFLIQSSKILNAVDLTEMDHCNDMLLAVINDDYSFIKTFCDVLSQQNVQYDMISWIHLIKLSQDFTKQILFSLKSTLSKMLFFAKSESINNLDFIKSNALFYKNGQGKCLVWKQKSINSKNIERDIEELEETMQKFNFDVTEDIISEDFKSHKHLFENGFIQNTHKWLFVFLIVDSKFDANFVKQLVEHLSSVENLFGKPKLIFLLGSYQLSENHYFENNSYNSNLNIYRLPKYADFMLFHSEHVSNSIRTLVKNLSENASKYDLMTILMNFIEDIVPDRPLLVNWIYSFARKLIYWTNIQRPSACINSTLTRLIPVNFEAKEKTLNLINLSNRLPIENRGKCIIFNHYKFENYLLRPREGTHKDADDLEKTFKKLEFNINDIKSYLDLRQDDTKTIISQIDCTGFHSLVLCFLSHGDENEIHCYDGAIKRDDILKSISSNKTLNGKPKIVIFQACRGNKNDYGVTNSKPDIINPINSPLSSYPDLFVFCSSYRGYYSWRDPNEGSWFIQALCKTLRENHNDVDFVTMATMVCRIVSQHSSTDGIQIIKQMPTFYSTLKKPIILSID